VLLDKNTQNLSIDSKAILILSPSLYWFHKEKLDIPLSQAKKIAPSLFEGMLPQGEYSYHVQKVGDEYWFFAYNDAEIIQKLSSLGIKPNQISKVYPAQIALQNIDKPVEIEDKALINQEGTVIALPKSLVQEPTQAPQDLRLSLPKQALPLKTYSTSMISEDLIYAFSIVVFLFILAYAVQIFLEKRDLAKLSQKERFIIKKYNLPPTSIQIKNIISSLKKIQKEQLALRDKLEAILRLPLQGGEYLQKIDFGKKISFEVVLLDPKRAEKIKEYLIKRCQVTKMSVVDKTLYVECRR